MCGLKLLVRAQVNGVFPTGWTRITTFVVPVWFHAGIFHRHASTHSLGVTYAFLLLITTMNNTLAVRTSRCGTPYSYLVVRECDGGSHDRNLPTCPETPPFPLSSIMGPATMDFATEKKGHICPPSKAIHPCNRWECIFVYAFICKLTNLRGKTDGLNSPMECVWFGFVSFATLTPFPAFFFSFEEALLSTDPNPILTQILARFVLNLRPLTRNLRCVRVVVDPSNVLNNATSSSFP